MKRLLTLTIVFTAVCGLAQIGFAGPERMSSGKEVVPPPPVPSSCFDGWYFGIHGGGILTNFDTETSAFEETIAPREGFSDFVFQSTGKHDKSTWEGGLHAGRNWQRGGWVFGLEVDIQGTDLERKGSIFDFIQLPGGNSDEHIYTTAIDSKAALDWYATGRARIGHTLGDRFLAFITGGGAIGLAEVSEVTSVHESTRFGGEFTDQFSESNRRIRGGWTAGAGFDFCLTEHWLLNFTYLYTDLGDASVGTNVFVTSGQGRTFDSQTRVSSDFKFHVFQGGLSFKF